MLLNSLFCTGIQFKQQRLEKHNDSIITKTTISKLVGVLPSKATGNHETINIQTLNLYSSKTVSSLSMCICLYVQSARPVIVCILASDEG